MNRPNTAIHLNSQDRREFGKRRNVLHAWIVPSSLQRLPCCVRNVSHGGALLELPVPFWLPTEFDLWVDAADIRVQCDLRHRGKHGVGITFRDLVEAQDLLDYCNVQPISAPAHGTAVGGLPPPRLTSALIRSILHRPEK